MNKTQENATNVAEVETVLVDEKELVSRLVENVEAMNRQINKAYTEEHKKYGINPQMYAGGLMCAMCSKGMSLEQNIKNLLAIFQSNFMESLFFQCRYIKLMEALRAYPQAKELINILQSPKQ